MSSTNVFKEMCVKITFLRSTMRNLTGICNAVYFPLCIDLMHTLPPVTAEGFDGSHHPRCAEWQKCSWRVLILPVEIIHDIRQVYFGKIGVNVCEIVVWGFYLSEDISLF